MNVQEAKTHLSTLLRRVAAGEEIVIARRRRLGTDRGAFRVPEDFDTPLIDEIREFFDS